MLNGEYSAYNANKEKEIREFYNSIDWTEFENTIRQRLKLDFLTFNYQLVNDSQNLGMFKIKIKNNENLTEKNYLLSQMFKDCYISSFASLITINRLTDEIYWNTSIYFTWTYHNGSTNGTALCNVEYTKKNKFNILFEKDKIDRDNKLWENYIKVKEKKNHEINN